VAARLRTGVNALAENRRVAATEIGGPTEKETDDSMNEMTTMITPQLSKLEIAETGDQIAREGGDRVPEIAGIVIAKTVVQVAIAVMAAVVLAAQEGGVVAEIVLSPIAEIVLSPIAEIVRSPIAEIVLSPIAGVGVDPDLHPAGAEVVVGVVAVGAAGKRTNSHYKPRPSPGPPWVEMCEPASLP